MFYLERFKRRWYSQKSWDTKKVRPAYIRERVVAPRTPGRVNQCTADE
ncbi:hypothetical protein T03_2758 [Trichinella britovi]|uniref:Uncharacterized protein n=1 Tax=Trichinella britovi TaxID=45882 RepID=A0A0V1A0B4_TRIBR|nr:hypothetical protein T03_2758 [Trichinella britovi]